LELVLSTVHTYIQGAAEKRATIKPNNWFKHCINEVIKILS